MNPKPTRTDKKLWNIYVLHTLLIIICIHTLLEIISVFVTDIKNVFNVSNSFCLPFAMCSTTIFELYIMPSFQKITIDFSRTFNYMKKINKGKCADTNACFFFILLARRHSYRCPILCPKHNQCNIYIYIYVTVSFSNIPVGVASCQYDFEIIF